MLGTAIFYTAFLSTVLQINGLDERQLQQVLSLLESRAANTKSSSSSSESSSGSDDTDSVDLTLRTTDIMKLIQQAIKNKKDTQNYVKDHKFKAKSNQLYENSQYEFSKNNNDNSGIKSRLLELFIQKDKKPLKNNNRERLSPNRLLGPVNYIGEGESGTKTGLNKYSKIFVVLDPIALQKSGNTENLPKLLSRILAETSSTVNKARKDKNKVVGSYYKGFAVKDNSKSRRFRRESREMYGGVRGGDVDDEYRPNRPRSEHAAGGGGGGGGGRTAIPYIRQRGDIYERA